MLSVHTIADTKVVKLFVIGNLLPTCGKSVSETNIAILADNLRYFLYICRNNNDVMKPTIIIDANIPYIRGVFEPVADVSYLNSHDMTREAVAVADALIVRTRTVCNRALLSGSRVKFIATATIGTDHIDAEYCRACGIKWSNAPGCNAASVAQYIGSAMAYYARQYHMNLQGKTIGIVGHGHVGHAVERCARILGMQVLLNDPFRAEADPDSYVSLDTVASEADIVTIHTPLTHSGRYPTQRLIDKKFFDRLARRPLIINAARGEIIDETDLLSALHEGRIADCVIDCWANEPNINPQLLETALIATPHIAGYSADGKYSATRQSVDATCDFFGFERLDIEPIMPQHTVVTNVQSLAGEMLRSYDILSDSERLKNAPQDFEYFRNHYPVRRETDWIVM